MYSASGKPTCGVGSAINSLIRISNSLAGDKSIKINSTALEGEILPTSSAIFNAVTV